jgi:hypothetical protein
VVELQATLLEELMETLAVHDMDMILQAMHEGPTGLIILRGSTDPVVIGRNMATGVMITTLCPGPVARMAIVAAPPLGPMDRVT